MSEKQHKTLVNILNWTKLMTKVNPVHTRKVNLLQNAGFIHKPKLGSSARISREGNIITRRWGCALSHLIRTNMLCFNQSGTVYSSVTAWSVAQSVTIWLWCRHLPVLWLVRKKSLPVPQTVPFRVVKRNKICWVWFCKQFQFMQAKHSSERYRSKLILKPIRTKLITFHVDKYVG